MNRIQAAIFLLVSVTLAGCSGLGDSGVTPPLNGVATVNLTISDTPPAGVSVLSFTVAISGVQLTGTASGIAPINPTPATFELTRLQSDTASAGTFTTVPTDTYTNVVVGISSASVTYLNSTSAAIGACLNNTVCTVSSILPTSPITVTTGAFAAPGLVLTNGQTVNLNLDFHLNTALTFTGSTPTVDFTQVGALTATVIPSTTPLHINDFTGTVTAVSGTQYTVQSGTRGTLTFVTNGSTAYNDPQSKCPAGGSTCLGLKTNISVDAVMNQDGTFTASEVDYLDLPAVDEVEGIIGYTSTPGTYLMIVSDTTIVTTGSALATTKPGAVITFTLANAAQFIIDTKNLPISTVNGFSGTNDLLSGQEIMIHVQSTAAGSGTNPLNVVTDQLRLRFSRFTGLVGTVAGNSFTLQRATLPSYIQSPSAPTFTTDPIVQVYPGQTTYEGITDVSTLTNGEAVAIRALYLNTLNPTFNAATVRLQSAL